MSTLCGRPRCSFAFGQMLLGALWFWIWPGPAAAQVQPGDPSQRTLAIQLFDEGDRLMLSREFAAACPKLAESYRLDPQLGVLLYLAECYEEVERLASAWGAYRQAEELALRRNDDRVEQARAGVRRLEPKLSRLQIVPPEGARPAGYQLQRDQVQIAPALWDTAVALDSGRYRIKATAPGYVAWSTLVEVPAAGGVVRVNVPALVAATNATASSSTGSASLVVQQDSASAGDNQRIAALGVGGLGLIGLGVGGYFALNARGAFSDSLPLCGDGDFCVPRGVGLRERALDQARLATIAAGVGLVGVVVSAVLWFTAPAELNSGAAPTADKLLQSSLSLRLGAARATLELRGGF